MSPTERILGALKDRGNNPTRNARGWTSRCPAHDDRRPSLSIAEGEEGRALVRCHAGCTADAICAEIGLRVSELMPIGQRCSRQQPANGKAKHKRPAKCYSTAREAVGRCWRRQLGERSETERMYHNARGELKGLAR